MIVQVVMMIKKKNSGEDTRSNKILQIQTIFKSMKIIQLENS